MMEILKKKSYPKISKNKKGRSTLKIFGRAISSHLISFRFLPFSGDFQRSEEKKFTLNRSRKVSCNRRKKIFADTSRDKVFLPQRGSI